MAFLFYFLSYQMQSSKVITFFVNFFLEEKEKEKKNIVVLLILRRKMEEMSENESLVHKWTIQNFKIWISKEKESWEGDREIRK